MLIKDRLAAGFGLAYIAALSVGIAYGLYHSMHWPVVHDATIFHYIAWRILSGATPYRDIFNGDMPGLYLLHMLCQTVLGMSDIAFRLYDLLFCGLTAGVLMLAGWKHSRLFALAAGLLFTAYHLARGPFDMGEKDFFLVPFLLLAAHAFLLALKHPQSRLPAFLTGAAAGWIFWIKPVALVFPCLCAAAILFQPWPRRTKIKSAAALAAGWLLLFLLMHLWLYASGGLADFYDILFSFTLPVYSKLGGFSNIPALLPEAVADMALIAAMLFLVLRRAELGAPEKTVTAILLAYGFLHFYLQGKGLPYHVYPLWGAYAWYVAFVLPALRFRKKGDLACVYGLVLCLCIAVSPLDKIWSDDYAETDAILALKLADRQKLTESVRETLRTLPPAIREKYAPDGDLTAHLQFFDSTFAQTADVLYHERWIPVSRHLMFFPLYYPLDASFSVLDHPSVRRLAEELHASLQKKVPLVIVVSAQSFPYQNGVIFKMIDASPLWHPFFHDYYKMVAETRRYRIYARKL